MTETLRAEVTKSVCSTRWRERLLLCDYVLYLFQPLTYYTLCRLPCRSGLVFFSGILGGFSSLRSLFYTGLRRSISRAFGLYDAGTWHKDLVHYHSRFCRALLVCLLVFGRRSVVWLLAGKKSHCTAVYHHHHTCGHGRPNIPQQLLKRDA